MTDEGRVAGAGRARPSDSAKARRNRLDELVAALLDGEMTSEVVSGIAQAIAEDDLLGQIRIHNLLCHWSAERDRVGLPDGVGPQPIAVMIMRRRGAEVGA